MRFLNLILILLMWTEAVFAVSTTDNNKVVGKTLKVADKFVSGTNFVNGDFEDSPITGWTVAHSALTSLIPTSTTTAGTALSVGTGLTAATNLALTATSANPLAGAYSGLLTASATSTAGDLLISPAIAIPNSAKAKMITIGFSYSASSAINLSGTASNSFAVYVYDIDNATWIQPAGTYGMIDGSTYAQVKNITFQTSSNGTKYQLAIVNINSIAAYTLKIDEIYFGTQAYSSGAAMSDWKSFTPNIKGSTTDPTIPTSAVVRNISGYYRRVGDSAEICENFLWDGTISGGAAGSGIYLFTIPSGLSIDLNKVTYYSADPSAPTAIGSASVYSSSAAPTGRHSGFVKVYNSQYLTVTAGSGAAIGLDQISSAWGQIEASATKVYNFCAIVPIVGWSSNTVQSADSDGRIVAARYTTTTVQNIPNAVATTLVYTTKDFDTHSAFNPSTGEYTCPSSGIYRATVTIPYIGIGAAALITSTLYKNGVGISDIVGQTVSSGSQTRLNGSILTQCNAGDVLKITTFQSAGSTQAVNGAGVTGMIQVEKLSGSPIVQASESVNARYSNSAGTTVGASATLIPFSTKNYDSHSAYNTSTGIYTCPVSGKYTVKATLLLSSAITPATSAAAILLFKNGSGYSEIARVMGSGGSNYMKLTGSDSVPCLQGETLSIYAWNANGALPLSADASSSFFSIERIGN